MLSLAFASFRYTWIVPFHMFPISHCFNRCHTQSTFNNIHMHSDVHQVYGVHRAQCMNNHATQSLTFLLLATWKIYFELQSTHLEWHDILWMGFFRQGLRNVRKDLSHPCSLLATSLTKAFFKRFHNFR